MDHKPQQFASDNYSGICPEAFEYLVKANTDHDHSYGDDRWTTKAANLFRALFETDCEVFFVFNGTAANSLSLSALCQSYHSIICHEVAHIETDECGAPEFFSNGAKILLSKGENGKMTPEGIREIITKRSDIHYPKPQVLSLTQATEVVARLDLLLLKLAAPAQWIHTQPIWAESDLTPTIMNSVATFVANYPQDFSPLLFHRQVNCRN